MKRITLAILLTAFLFQGVTLFAQSKAQKREEWQKVVTEYKHDFITNDLNLTNDQQGKFFPLYDKMEEETSKLVRETRMLENKISKQLKNGENVSDVEFDAATQAIYGLKIKEGEIEKEYLTKFKQILTKKQLFQLKVAERKFAKELIKIHRKKKHGSAKK